jgi:hypothetical protein
MREGGRQLRRLGLAALLLLAASDPLQARGKS